MLNRYKLIKRIILNDVQMAYTKMTVYQLLYKIPKFVFYKFYKNKIYIKSEYKKAKKHKNKNMWKYKKQSNKFLRCLYYISTNQSLEDLSFSNLN